MLVIKQHRIYRQDLKNNPKLLYLFGDNVERVGYGGQAKEMRGEPNAFGITTKWSPSIFFYGNPKELEIVQSDFSRMVYSLFEYNYRGLVIPSDGIGTGLAQLEKFNPTVLAYINNVFDFLHSLSD